MVKRRSARRETAVRIPSETSHLAGEIARLLREGDRGKARELLQAAMLSPKSGSLNSGGRHG